MTTPYSTGQISLVNGSAMVTGIGTGWSTSLIIGGTIYVEAAGGNALPILEIGGDTEITAAIAWTGATGTYDYALVRDTAYGQQTVANAQALADYIQRLNSTALAAIEGVTPAAETVLMFTGPSTATVVPRSAFIQGGEYDVQVNNLAARAAYDSKPGPTSSTRGFAVLVSNIGDGRAAIYSKLSDTTGDWSQPGPLTGAKGDSGPFTEITIGPTTTLPYGSQATVTVVLVDADTVRLDFGIPAGQNGTGTGDVVGPSSSMDNELALFSGTSGKQIKRGPLLSSLGSGQNEAILALEIADLKGARLGMKGGVADAFDDETGVATKTNATYDAANDWYVPTSSGGIDSNTIVMLHGDGTDGSTTFTDSALTPNMFTPAADAKIKTDQSVFGGASMRFDGALDRISCPDSAALRLSGDFTIDFRIRYAGSGGFQTIFDKGYTAAGSFLIQSDQSASPKLQIYLGSTLAITESSGASLNTWYHYAIVRSGNTLTMYRDGVSVGSASMTAGISNTSPLAIGAKQSDGSLAFNGWLDEFRFSAVARWAAPFTPPTAAYAPAFTQNMTLRSVSYAAASVPSTGRIAVQIVETDTITPNTDLIARMSRNGGTTWATGTLSVAQSLIGPKMLEATGIDLTGMSSGSSMLWEIVTANGKNVAVSGLVAQWS